MNFNTKLQFIQELDTIYEEDIIRHPFVLKSWLRYLEYNSKSDSKKLLFIYERALLQLPASYKLWKKYLDLRISEIFNIPATQDKKHATVKYAVAENIKLMLDYTPKFPLDNEIYAQTNACFEKALVLCNKCPVIWLMYCAFLMHQRKTTFTRRTFDRSLQALAITQHPLIWRLYLVFAERTGGETCVRIWRRYLKLESSASEMFSSMLLDMHPPRYAESARIISKLVITPGYQSTNGKSQFQLWSQLCDIVTEHPDEIDQAQDFTRLEQLDVDSILRAGITKFTDHVGKIWNSLARWWILKGEWDQARDVYEEAMFSVINVRDFTIIFDTYAKMEEDLLAAQIEEFDKKEKDSDSDSDFDELDLEMGLARFERLMDRRPFLLNDVILRQNPNNVEEWCNRVELWKERENFEKVLETYSIATRMILGKKATPGYSQFWISYARYYLEHDQIDHARQVYENAVQSSFKSVEELVEIWCSFAEMEISISEPRRALDILCRACAPPRGPPSVLNGIRFKDESKEPAQRIFKSLKLWSFLVDLEESIGTLETSRAAYDKILDLKIATPQIVLNYATFLEEKLYFEESFRVYERGIELFGYPVSFEIWNVYLDKFIKRYEGSKIDRTRDLFEHALDKIPEKFAKVVYLRYAKFEEDFGLAKKSMSIYDRATKFVSEDDRLKVFQIYIAKATSHFGLSSTREIYSKAIEVLPDKECRQMCISFAQVEIRLGEIDRARVIYGHASQMCDPKIDVEFWKLWSDFEVKYGNEDTFKEMLRIKRSVQAKFNVDVTFMSAQLMATKQTRISEETENEEDIPKTMADLEAQAIAAQLNTKVVGFVRAQETEPVHKEDKIENSANPDEIKMDDSDDNDDDEEDMDVERVQVPAAVFGSLKREEVDLELGAKERMKRKR